MCHALMLRGEETAGMGIRGILQCGIHSSDEMEEETLVVTGFPRSNHANAVSTCISFLLADKISLCRHVKGGFLCVYVFFSFFRESLQ